MMVERIIRRREVLTLRARSNAAHYLDIKQGLFTRPVPIGKQAVGWPEREVAVLNAARIAGKTDDEIKKLVEKLHQERLTMHD